MTSDTKIQLRNDYICKKITKDEYIQKLESISEEQSKESDPNLYEPVSAVSRGRRQGDNATPSVDGLGNIFGLIITLVFFYFWTDIKLPGILDEYFIFQKLEVLKFYFIGLTYTMRLFSFFMAKVVFCYILVYLQGFPLVIFPFLFIIGFIRDSMMLVTMIFGYGFVSRRIIRN